MYKICARIYDFKHSFEHLQKMIDIYAPLLRVNYLEMIRGI